MENRWTRFFGIIGTVVFLFGIAGGILLNGFDQLLIVLHLVVGLAMLGVWFFTFGIKNLGGATQVVRGRRTRFGLNALLYTVCFVGILACINWFVYRNNGRWDLTENSVYSLSGQSASILEKLQRPLRLVAFQGNGAVDEDQMNQLFGLYRHGNPSKVKTEIADPRAKPYLIDSLGMKQGNIVYLEYGEGETKGVSRINDFSEEAITNAIIKLTRGEARKIYFVQGHDEPDIQSNAPDGLREFAEAIEDEHLKMEGLRLGTIAEMPKDAAAVVLVSPKKPLLAHEMELITKYVESGGSFVLLTDPRTTADAKELAKHFNIEIGDNVVIDQVQRLFDAPALGVQPVVEEYGQHAISRDFGRRRSTIFNIASTVRASGKSGEGVTYTELLKTSPTSWAETNLAAIFDSSEPMAKLEKDDLPGPVPLAVVYEKDLSPPKPEQGQETNDTPAEFRKLARIVVFGDSDWITNSMLSVYSNRDLILNALSWAVGEEGGVSIRAKTMRVSLAPMPHQELLLILSASFVIPELVLILGLYVWWTRRTAEGRRAAVA